MTTEPPVHVSQPSPGEVLAAEQTQTVPAGGFLPIDLALIVTGPTRQFDLYQRIGGELVLFCARDFPILRKSLDRLLEQGIESLYVPTEQGDALSHYAETVLRDVVADRKVGLPRRSSILYKCARSIMADILADPSAPGIVQRGAALASTTVSLVTESPGAMKAIVALFGKDYYTFTHCVHVCVLGVGLCKYLLTPDETILRRFGTGALLHDVGKTAVDQNILSKPGRLTQEEFVQMKSHAELGWDLLSRQGLRDDLIRHVVLHHHEKLDGTGYPDRLRADEIVPHARLAAIVDVYDALTTDRPYRNAMDRQQAIDLMRNQMIPGQLDGEYFTAFEKYSRRLPSGATESPPVEPQAQA